MTLSAFTYSSPLGSLHLLASEDYLLQLTFSAPSDQTTVVQQENSIIRQAKQELDAYFDGKLISFRTPLQFDDTAFRMRVWQQLREIPFGQTISYLSLAKQLGDAKCIRAAGTANGRNPVAIIVPCHRVIGNTGSLVGYAGELWRKRWLLEHEAKFAHGIQTLFE
ncbi:MAG: methylated-DNA--[protein]-cysteine S-methyltransferase [Chitinophagaceae bacterium]